MRRVFKFLGYVLVTIYFVADFMFEAVALPLSAWIGRLEILRPVNAWIASLRPYPALALFSRHRVDCCGRNSQDYIGRATVQIDPRPLVADPTLRNSVLLLD